MARAVPRVDREGNGHGGGGGGGGGEGVGMGGKELSGGLPGQQYRE